MANKETHRKQDGTLSTRWRVYFRDHHDKRRSRSFPTLAEARKFERGQETLVAAANLREQGVNPEGLLQVAGVGGHVTVNADFLDAVEKTVAKAENHVPAARLVPKFLAYKGPDGSDPIEPSSLRTHERRLGNAFEFLDDSKLPQEVSPEDVLAMIKAMRASDRFAEESIENTLTSLRTFFAWMLKQKLYKGDNPVEGIHALKKKDRVLIRPVTEDMILSRDQMERVIGWLEQQVARVNPKMHRRYVRKAIFYRAFLLLAIQTGMRNGELRGLLWRHLDWDSKIILVRQSLDMETDEVGLPKTVGSIREVPMVSTVRRALAALAEFDGTAPDRLVFAGPRKKTLLTYNTSEKMWKTAQAHAGIGEPKNFHSIRHYFASDLFDKGYAADRVSEMLGHHSVDFTRKVYVHIMNKQKRIAHDVEALEAALVKPHAAA